MDLPAAPSCDLNFRHTCDLRQPVTQILVSDSVQFVYVLRAGKGESYHRSRCKIKFSGDWILRIRRQESSDLIELVADVHRLDVYVLLQIELDYDKRHALL